MAFGHNSHSADMIFNRIKYNAKAGRMFRVDNVSDGNGGFKNEQHDVSDKFNFIVDPYSFQHGWIMYKPTFNRVLASVQSALPDKPVLNPAPSDKKMGYKGVVTLSALLAPDGEVYELSVTASIVQDGIEHMYNQWAGHANSKDRNKVPVFSLIDNRVVNTKNGVVFCPEFKLVQWLPRPAQFDPEVEEAPVQQQSGFVQPSQPSPVQNGQFSQPALNGGNTQSPPPAAQPVMADANDDLPF